MLNYIKILLICLTLTKGIGSLAQIVNIPDPNFKSALLSHSPIIDVNGDGEIQISEAEALMTHLTVDNSYIQDLTGVEAFINIVELDCSYNELTSLNLSQNENIEHLWCQGNTDLIVIDFPIPCHLKQLDITGTSKSAFMGADFPELINLWCGFLTLSLFDVTQNTALEYVACYGSSLTDIDLSNNINLIALDCSGCPLTSLDVSSNQQLSMLRCNNCALSNLDLTSNYQLEELICNNNQLNALNIQNGNNQALGYLDATYNSNLFCIQVDDVNYAVSNSSWYKDAQVEYDTLCPYNGYSFRDTLALNQSDSIYWEGMYIDSCGTYISQYIDQNGNDSTYTLIVIDTYIVIDSSICSNDSILWEGIYYSEEGTYEVLYNSMNGCDSIRSMTLTLNPSYNSNEPFSICTGDSLFWEGDYYSNPGMYEVTYNSLEGCDSIISLELSLEEQFEFTESFTICWNDSLFWHEAYYSPSGEFTQTYQTLNGCDSIYHLILDSYPLPSAPVIFGEDSVTLNQIELYYIGEDLLVYVWNVVSGEIVSQISSDSVEIQWTEFGTGFVYVQTLDSCGILSDTTILSVNIDLVGMNQLDLDPSIKIYPNPADHYLNIECDYSFIMELFTMDGKIVKETIEKSIDISRLNPANYIAVVKDENGVLKSIQTCIIK